MELVLDDGGPHRRDVSNLVAERLRVLAGERLSAASALGRLEGNGLLHLLRRHQETLLGGPPWLSAASFTGGRGGRAAFGSRGIGGGRLGGVGGILVQTPVQLVDLSLLVLQTPFVLGEDGQQGGLGGWWDLLPQFS
jgi:hypothetical protein